MQQQASRREAAAKNWPITQSHSGRLTASDHTTVGWPNITVIQGRLLGLGRPETLPSNSQLIDLYGAAQPFLEAVTRPVLVLTVTPPTDRQWVADIQTRWPGYRLVLVGDRAMLTR